MCMHARVRGAVPRVLCGYFDLSGEGVGCVCGREMEATLQGGEDP